MNHSKRHHQSFSNKNLSLIEKKEDHDELNEPTPKHEIGVQHQKNRRKAGYAQKLKQMQEPSQEAGGDENWLISYADMMTLLFGFFALLMSFSKLDIERFEKAREETTKFFGGEYQIPFEKMKNELSDQVKKQQLGQQVLLATNEKGIAITFRGALFFDLGASEIRPEALSLLEKIIPVIKKQNNTFNIQIEGHTDDNPITGAQFPSNWELSALRAVNVLHFFEKMGFNKESLQAIGLGETQPIVPNRNTLGEPIKDNQAQNRRVVIRLLKAQPL